MRLIKFYGHWINPLAIEFISEYGSPGDSIISFNSGESITVPEPTETVVKALAERSSKGLVMTL